MKDKIKVTAIDDGQFNREKDKQTTLIATTTQGPTYIENIESTTIKIDGLNSTQKIIQMIQNSNQIQQSKAILTNGTTVAGFNILDHKKINKETGKPIIATLKKKPNKEKVEKALQHTEKKEKRMKIIDKNPKYHQHGEIHYSTTGMKKEKAEKLLDKLTYRGNYPEPLRISHLIASGVTEYG